MKVKRARSGCDSLGGSWDLDSCAASLQAVHTIVASMARMGTYACAFIYIFSAWLGLGDGLEARTHLSGGTTLAPAATHGDDDNCMPYNCRSTQSLWFLRCGACRQEELAHKAGLHRTYIGMLERGQRTPSLLTVALVAKALGTSVAALVKGLDRHV